MISQIDFTNVLVKFETKKAICKHSPRLRAIQGFKRLHKAMQGNSYKQKTRPFILIG